MKFPFFTATISDTASYEKMSHVESQTVEGGVVLLDSREAEILHLNEVGATVWEGIDGQRNFAQLAAYVSERFDAPLSQINKDVSVFIRKLLERELILEKKP